MKKPKVEQKKKSKPNKSIKKIDRKKSDEESASNTIEWDLSDDKPDGKANEDDQMTLF